MMDWKEFFNDFADRYYSVPDFTNKEHVYALQNYLIEQGMLVEDVDFAIKTLLGEAPDKPTNPKIAQQAKKMGLVWKRNGYGPENKKGITHKVDDDKLVPVDDKKDDGKDKKGKEDDKKPTNLSKGGKVDAQLGGDRDASPTDMMDKDDVGKIKKDDKPKKMKKSFVSGDLSKGDNQVKSDMLEHGYTGYQKATGKKPAPGGAGSAFNEIMSGEGVKILMDNPDMTEEDLAREMYERTKETNLGREQKATVGIGKRDIPEDIENTELYSKCLVSARSAKKKLERTKERVKKLQKNKKFGKPKKVETFYGAQESMDAQVRMIEEAKTVLLPNGQEVDKEDAIAFIRAGGKGMNPSDTATFVTDDKGNLLIQFHSDKTTTNDIQDNSTLMQEGENFKNYIDNDPNLTDKEKEEAKKLIDEYSEKINDIEENYNNQAAAVANALLTVSEEEVSEVLKTNPQGAQKNMSKALYGDNGEPPANSKFEKYLPEGKTLDDDLTLEEQYKMLLRYAADNNDLTAEVTKSINKVGLAVQKRNPDIGGLDVKKNLSEQREQVVSMQRERVEKLNELKEGLGTSMEAKEVSRSFHFNMMDYPPKKYEKGNPNSIMGAAMDVNMGGNIVDGEVLKKCLGVKNSKEFEEDMKIEEVDELQYDKKGNVTGKNVYTYVIDKKGKRTEIGYKTYRSKNGAAGKTQNTMSYSKDMQDCFKGKK